MGIPLTIVEAVLGSYLPVEGLGGGPAPEGRRALRVGYQKCEWNIGFGQVMAVQIRLETTNTQLTSPEYFPVMRIPLIRGRVLNEWDTNPTPSSVVVNQVLARKIWPGEARLANG